MYPSLQKIVVDKEIKLKDLLLKLGKEYLYSYERNTLGVYVKNRAVYPSMILKPGDEVIIYPVIAGGTGSGISC